MIRWKSSTVNSVIGASRCHSRVVHEDVDPAVVGLDAANEPDDLVLLRDVAVPVLHPAAGLDDLLRGGFAALVVTSTPTTIAPSTANWRAIASPIPRAVPVMIATLFSSLPLIGCHSSPTTRPSGSTWLTDRTPS